MDLGQVFTSRTVSDFMVSLFSEDKTNFLDPCFGEGVFINSLLKKKPKNITGYEIDNKLFNNFNLETDKYSATEIQLINGDFLMNSSLNKFDGIIINPPYLRHEKIDDLCDYGVTKQALKKIDIYRELPATANFYMYFIAKCLNLLESNGEIIIIFPESWQGGSNEKYFYKMLDSFNAHIDQYINIKGDIFETKPVVDVIILKIVKSSNGGGLTKKEFVVKCNNILEIKQNQDATELNLGFTTSILEYAKTRRGLTTGSNKIFINPNIKKSKNLRQIISSPKDINGFDAANSRLDTVLILQKDSELSSEEEKYLQTWEKTILEEKKPKTLYNAIINNKNWYFLNPINGIGIIFGYIVRENIKFILNKSDVIVRDNFYILSPKIDNYLLMALLNNYYVYYQLEKLGKRHGKGVLKIQKYDLDDLKLPNVNELEGNNKKELTLLGKELSESLEEKKVQEIVIQITKILSQYSNINASTIKSSVEKIKEERLES